MKTQLGFGSPGYGPPRKRRGGEQQQYCEDRWHYLTLVTVLMATFAISACVVFTDVSNFAKASQAVGKNFATIQDSGESSCTRANTFVDPSYNNIPPLNCKEFSDIKAPLAKVNQALFNYISALGNLANDDLSKVGSGFDNIQSELKAAGVPTDRLRPVNPPSAVEAPA